MTGLTTFVPIAEQTEKALTTIASHRGRLLAGAPTTQYAPLRVACHRNHQFNTNWKLLRRGHWCRKCAALDRAYRGHRSIEAMRQLAAERGGSCLSPEYKGSTHHLDWRCAEGHVWRAKPTTISQGRWCPKCAAIRRGRPRRTIKDLNELAGQRGGKCLSKAFGQTDALLEWECALGHRWRARAKSIAAGKWCHICAGNKRLTIDDARALAASRGGKCISDQLPSTRHKLVWECAHGHRWNANYNQLSNCGSWCPVCSSGLGERLCRVAFEKLFGVAFPKARPEWLLSDEGNRMELDGYAESIRLGFEHQGKQHYEDVAGMKRGGDLARRRHLDRIKRERCSAHGVTLIEIPDVFSFVGVKNLATSVFEACLVAGVRPSQDPRTFAVDFRDAYVTNGAIDRTRTLRETAKERGGRLLSPIYMGHRTKLLWECSSGHQWEALPQAIFFGYWCPECSLIRRRLPWKLLEEEVAKRGGVLIARTEAGCLHLRCAKGHEWETRASNFRSGRWCPTCAGKMPVGINWVRHYAQSQGGECLSSEYKNNMTPVRLRCSAGHVWTTKTLILRRGAWCPRCARVKTASNGIAN